MYIPCLYKKDLLRGDFGFLQRGPKRVISEIGFAFWRQGYAYILSMGKGVVRIGNTSSFFVPTTAHRWTAISVGAVRNQIAIGTLSNAIGPIPSGSSNPSPTSRRSGKVDLRPPFSHHRLIHWVKRSSTRRSRTPSPHPHHSPSGW